MLADVDLLVGGNSSISFNPNFQFRSEVDEYNCSPKILSPENSNFSCGTGNGRLDFVTALGSSPNSSPYLGHSPPTHFTFHARCSSPTLKPIFPSAPEGLHKNFNRLRIAPSESNEMPVAVPRRSCLVVRCNVLDFQTSNKNKKKVVFADDRGFPLTLVRTMTEPSNVPPQLSFHFLAKMAEDSTGQEIGEAWELIFPQPASDYLDFRRRLDNNNVSLENVIVKEIDQMILGTVKVRNLVFHKEVFMRTTSNNWKTQQDIYCTYVPNGPSQNSVGILYDTFSFRFALPSNSKEVEFCVCFKCDGAEYWDNNNGKNYFIVKKEIPNKRSATMQSVGFESSAKEVINFSQKSYDEDENHTRLESWSEFASWNHLQNGTPYW